MFVAYGCGNAIGTWARECSGHHPSALSVPELDWMAIKQFELTLSLIRPRWICAESATVAAVSVAEPTEAGPSGSAVSRMD